VFLGQDNPEQCISFQPPLRWPAPAGIEKPARAARMGTSDRPPDVVGYVPTVEEALQLLKMLAHVRLVCRRKGWPSLTTSRAWWIAAAALRECQADGDEGPDQHTDRGQSALRGETGFAHSGHSLAGISSERPLFPARMRSVL
jgi:hypothetical protein